MLIVECVVSQRQTKTKKKVVFERYEDLFGKAERRSHEAAGPSGGADHFGKPAQEACAFRQTRLCDLRHRPAE